MNEIETLRTAIERFIAERDIPPSRFGRLAAGDPSLVLRIRNGRELRYATRKRVIEYMEANKGKFKKK